ncbi:TPA: transcription antiterminator, partial [Enterococcus faecium]
MIERHVNLLKLLSRQEDFKPASFFSDKLAVSTKTIYQDIELLEDYVVNYQVTIERLPSLGIKLIGDRKNVEHLISSVENYLEKDIYSPEKRRVEIIKEVLFGDKPVSLTHLSQSFMVSKTSLYNDLRIINKIIGSGEVKLQSSAEGISFTGNEQAIQRAIKQLVFYYANDMESKTFFQVLNMLFDSKVISVIHDLLFNDYSELTEKVSDYYVRSLISTLVIQCNRLLKGHHLTVEEEFLFNSIRYMETYIVANGLIEELKAKLNLPFYDADKEYLCRQLFAHRVTNNLKTSNEEYAMSVHKLIERMSEIEKIDLTQNDRLYQSLLYHVPAMVLRLKKGIKIQNPLLENIKSQYSELFSIVWYAMSILEEEFDVTLTDDEVSLILIHFQIAIEDQSKANNIIIICQYGISSAQLIYNKVRRFLPAKDNVEISTLDKFHLAEIGEVDLIISSLSFDAGGIPLVRVSPLVSKTDYMNIMEAYTKYLIEEPSRFIQNELIPKAVKVPTISKFVQSSLVKTGVQVESKEECLDLMISELEANSLVTEEFRASIFSREKMGNTNLESGVALPHANPSMVIESNIFIVALKNAINWGDRKVKLVIMVSLAEEDVSEIRGVYEELYQFIGQKEMVDRLLQVHDSEKLLRI